MNGDLAALIREMPLHQRGQPKFAPALLGYVATCDCGWQADQAGLYLTRWAEHRDEANTTWLSAHGVVVLDREQVARALYGIRAKDPRPEFRGPLWHRLEEQWRAGWLADADALIAALTRPTAPSADEGSVPLDIDRCPECKHPLHRLACRVLDAECDCPAQQPSADEGTCGHQRRYFPQNVCTKPRSHDAEEGHSDGEDTWAGLS